MDRQKIIRTDVVSPCKNLHNHPVDLSLSYKLQLSSLMTSAFQRSVDAVAAEPTENRGGYLNSQDLNVWRKLHSY